MRAIEFILADEAKRLEEPEATLLKTASSEIIGLRNRLAVALRRGRLYGALIDAGVEDWEGFEEAMQQIREEEQAYDQE